MLISVSLTEEEKLLAEHYAKLHSISVSEAFKLALFEHIEDEYDITVGDETYRVICPLTPPFLMFLQFQQR